VARKKKKREQLTVPLDSAAAAPSTSVGTSQPTADLAAEAEPRRPVENLDDDLADLDEVGRNDSYDSLVAAVAEMEDEAEVRALAPGYGRPPEPDAGDEEIHDLDADDDRAGGIDRLIAEVGRGAPLEEAAAEPEDELPIIDLDEDVPAGAPRQSVADGTSRVDPDLSHLARAAAAGGVDQAEPRALPLDLSGDVSTPEARARLLAQALAHAEHKEARYRVPLADTRRAARWKSAAAVALLALAGVVAIAPPSWVRPEPPAQLGDAARDRGIRLALLLQAQQVEAYRVRAQQLPASLDDLPMRLAGLRYTRSGRSYQLVGFTPLGDAIIYDAADPSPEFRVLLGSLMSNDPAR
jgi:hypothetical protein